MCWFHRNLLGAQCERASENGLEKFSCQESFILHLLRPCSTMILALKETWTERLNGLLDLRL